MLTRPFEMRIASRYLDFEVSVVCLGGSFKSFGTRVY
jgi:hypothetical protein